MRERRIGKINIVAATVLLLCGLSVTAGAMTSLDSYYGTPVAAGSTRNAAMGGVGVSLLQGSCAVFQNPAALALCGTGASYDLTVGLRQDTEDRFIPLFDGFDNYIAETAIAVNRNKYFGAQGGLLAGNGKGFGLSVGLHDRYDLQYDYYEEVRDPDPDSLVRDTILQYNEIEGDGVIRSFSVGMGISLGSAIRLGASAHRFFGDVEEMRRVSPAAATGADIQSLDRSLGGTGFTLGGLVHIGPRLDLGISYDPALELSGDHTATFMQAGTALSDTLFSLAGVTLSDSLDGSWEIEYPATLNLGFTYRPRNELRTVFTLQATRRWWSDLEDPYDAAQTEIASAAGLDAAPRHLRDTWDLRLGLEHVFYNGTPLRIGLRYLENYADEESYRTIFSAGTGLVVADDYSIGITGQYHRQTSVQGYVFDVPVGDPPASSTKVEDSSVRLIVGVSKGF